MLVSLLFSLLLFFGVTFGLAWPVVARLTLSPLEKAITLAGLSLVGVFLVAWIIYVTALPLPWLWILPILAVGGLMRDHRSWVVLWLNPEVRPLGVAQGLITLWCVGWMATIVSYSGGGWAGDWFEHWERSRFFLEHWPLDRKFLEAYALPARPPLINIVTGAFLYLTQVDFAHYQLFTALLSSLVFLPAGWLALRWGGSRGIAVLAVLFMVSPTFVENATFGWTKLPTAFFVLSAVVFFLRAQDPQPPKAAAPLCGLLLAAAVLAHYSAGPYVVVLAAGWLALGWPHRRDRRWWRQSAAAGLLAFALLATWFAWSLWNYGSRGTFFSNSSVTGLGSTLADQVTRVGLNIRDTLVPHFLRDFDASLIEQRSPWGWWRDFFFQTYQVSFFPAFGSLAWLAIGRELCRDKRAASVGSRVFWLWFILGVFTLGIASVGQRDHWGLAHICLPPLILLGLAFLAARWTSMGPAWQRLLIVGGTVDFILGIGLQFAVQSYALDRWLTPGRLPEDVLTSYNQTALLNLGGKLRNQLTFFADAVPVPFELWLGVLVLLLIIAIRRAGPGRRPETGSSR